MDEATHEALPDELKVQGLRVKVARPGFRVDELVLVTTLCDGEESHKEGVAKLFLKRWDIALDFRSIKVVLPMDILRCRTPEMVPKEIGMH